MDVKPKHTRRHYEDTARILNGCFLEWPNEASLKPFRYVYEAFANLYATDNSRFDRRRFEGAVFKQAIK